MSKAEEKSKQRRMEILPLLQESKESLYIFKIEGSVLWKGRKPD